LSPDISEPEKSAARNVETLDSEAIGNIRDKLPLVQGGGGLAMCASGPLGMRQEAANAVAVGWCWTSYGGFHALTTHAGLFLDIYQRIYDRHIYSPCSNVFYGSRTLKQNFELRSGFNFKKIRPNILDLAL